MPAPVRFLLQKSRALQRLVLERELERGAHVRLEPLEERKRAVEELAHA